MHHRLCSVFNCNLRIQKRCMLSLVEASLNSTPLRYLPRIFCRVCHSSAQYFQACVDLRVPVICVGGRSLETRKDVMASLLVSGQRDLMVCASCSHAILFHRSICFSACRFQHSTFNMAICTAMHHSRFAAL